MFVVFMVHALYINNAIVPAVEKNYTRKKKTIICENNIQLK